MEFLKADSQSLTNDKDGLVNSLNALQKSLKSSQAENTNLYEQIEALQKTYNDYVQKYYIL